MMFHVILLCALMCGAAMGNTHNHKHHDDHHKHHEENHDQLKEKVNELQHDVHESQHEIGHIKHTQSTILVKLCHLVHGKDSHNCEKHEHHDNHHASGHHAGGHHNNHHGSGHHHKHHGTEHHNKHHGTEHHNKHHGTEHHNNHHGTEHHNKHHGSGHHNKHHGTEHHNKHHGTEHHNKHHGSGHHNKHHASEHHDTSHKTHHKTHHHNTHHHKAPTKQHDLKIFGTEVPKQGPYHLIHTHKPRTHRITEPATTTPATTTTTEAVDLRIREQEDVHELWYHITLGMCLPEKWNLHYGSRHSRVYKALTKRVEYAINSALIGKPGFVKYCVEDMVPMHNNVQVIGDCVFDIPAPNLTDSVTKDSLKEMVETAEHSAELGVNEAIHHLNVTYTSTGYDDSKHADHLITELEEARDKDVEEGGSGEGHCHENGTEVARGAFKTVAADEDGDTEVQKEVKAYERSCFCVETAWMCDESKEVDEKRIRKDEHDRHTTTVAHHAEEETEAHHVDEATEAHVDEATEAHVEAVTEAHVEAVTEAHVEEVTSPAK